MLALYWSLVAVMVVGIIGAVVPAIPGTSLILVAILIWGAVQGSFASIGLPLVVAIAVLIMGIGIDLLASYWGAKRAGASKWGQIGAIIGEYLFQRDLKLALKAGVGIVVGSLIGNLIQGLLAIAVVGVFLYATWGQVFAVSNLS